MTEPRLVGGRYELDGVVGRGGMAEVYRGRDARLDRQVAIKALRADLARDPTFQERFRREAQSAASLNHPSIVAVYDTGEDELGGGTVPYIVMEYVAGRTLRDMLHDDRHLLPERGLEIVDGILRALEYSHSNGIVHRDIKPANAMITTSREVKVMDFGIARAVHDVSATMTQTAQVIGTAQYLSPEQARGERVDARSDVYSTGCVLYEVLTGNPPFRGDSPVSIAYQHVREEPIPPSEVNPEVPEWADAIVLKAMTKDADNRYQSAAEMRTDVQRALAGQHVEGPVGGTQRLGSAMAAGGTTQALPGEGEDTPRRRGRRWRPWIVLPLVLLFLALAGLGGWFLTRELRGSDTPTADVPDVVGYNREGAETTLQRNGFNPNVVREFNDEQPRGEVFRQRPRAGVTRPQNSTVRIFVSRGPSTVQVPGNLVGMTEEAAKQTLQERPGLSVGETTQQSSSAPAGQVTATEPSPGANVQRGSSVDLVVSSGPATTEVPSVVGDDEDEAYDTLREEGFQVQTRYQRTTAEDEGTVFDQNPDGGTQVEPGSSVTIIVAQEPQETREPPPTGSPAPTDGDGDDDSPILGD